MNAKLCICLAATAALWIFAPVAKAAEVESGETGDPKPLVVLMVASQSQEELSQETIRALRGQLSDLPVDFQVAWVAPAKESPSEFDDLAASIAAQARADIGFWCSLDQPARIYLIVAGDDNRMVRSLNRTGAGGRAEAAAIIVRAVVNSQVEKRNRAQAKRTAGERSPPAQSNAPPPVPRAHNAMSLQLFYALEVQDAVRPVAQGFGLGIGVGLTERFVMFARYIFFERVSLSTSEVEIELRRHPVWLGTGFAKILKPFRIGAEVALIFDYVNDSTTVRDPSSVEAGPDGGGFLFSAVLQGLVAVRLLASVELFARVGAELPITQPRYVIESDEGRTVLEPWPLRPMGQVGVSIGFF